MSESQRQHLEIDDDLTYLANDLTASQHEAVFSPAMPLCIIAGAGAGKTRVLTRRVARRLLDGSAKADATLVVTFTRKAATELSDRLSKLGVDETIRSGTFHGIAYALLQQYWQLRQMPVRTVLPNKTAIVRPLLEKSARRVTPSAIRQAVTEIDWAKARSIDVAGYSRLTRRPSLQLSQAEFCELYRDYELVKAKRGLVDFEDLLNLVAKALVQDAAFSHAISKQVRHIFVDEFQDVNTAQFQLLKALLSGQEPADLCVVGDDDQAIFGFTGAASRYVTEFASMWPGGSEMVLRDNFRSSPEIVDTAQMLFKGSQRSSDKIPDVHCSSGPKPLLVQHDSADEEAQWATQTLRSQRHLGVAWEDMAILVRTNAQVTLFEHALSAHRIPHIVRSRGSFLGSPEVRHVFARLHKARRPPGQPFTSFVAELCGISAESPRVAGPDADELAGPESSPASDSTDDSELNLRSLVELAHEYASSGLDLDVKKFHTYVSAAVGTDTGFVNAKGSVSLLTMHRSKGLEFSTVICAGLEEGLVPMAASRTQLAIDEERRLLFVAITRCKHNLFLSWAKSRTTNSGGRASRKPSRFLDGLTGIDRHFASGHHPDDARTSSEKNPDTAPQWTEWISKARHELSPNQSESSQEMPSGSVPGRRQKKAAVQILDRKRECNHDLFIALCQWRDELAASETRARQEILADPILLDIACVEPRSVADLAMIPGIDRVNLERYGPALLEISSSNSQS